MKCLLSSTWGWLRIDWLLMMVKVHQRQETNNVLKRLCFVWHQWQQIFCKYQHTIPLTNVVMSELSACVIFFPLPSLLVVGMSIQDLHMLHWSLPRYSSLQVLLNRLVYNSCLRKGKTGWKLKQSWCWDFVVSREVYELLLTRIWLQQITCCRAGRERKEVLHFPGSSVGGSEQESPTKQSPFKRRLEQRNGTIEKYHQKNQRSAMNSTAKKTAASQNSFANGSGSQAGISSTKSSLA